MTKLLLIFYVAFSFSAKAQVSDAIVGKWNVVALFDEDVYCNIQKDSISVENSVRHAGLSKTAIDSAKMFLRPMFDALKNAYYIFNKDSTYETFIEAIGKEVGTFSVTGSPGIIELLGKGNKEKYIYKIEKNVLELKFLPQTEGMVLIMEKEIK